MNILIIKQTSLGDVLHSTGHVRTIKKTYPHSRLILLTADSSEAIYQHSPWVDDFILIDRNRIRQNWFKEPGWALAEMWRVIKQIRQTEFDLAIDLQGLARTVVFLYAAKADRKFVKGRWLALKGFRDKSLYALEEMDRVLQLAGINVQDTSMELITGEQEKLKVNSLLHSINPSNKPIMILSPFSRWESKDWPLQYYASIAKDWADRFTVIVTGTEDRKQQVEDLFADLNPGITNLAGALSLLEFAELADRAELMITGDSFPMHVAVAKNTKIVALFGPTDEQKVGPRSQNSLVVRIDGCDICYNKTCPRKCLSRLTTIQVNEALGEVSQPDFGK